MAEKEYVERETLKNEISSLTVSVGGKQMFNDEAKASVLRVIDEQPTADVQEVVRCKDCNYFSQTTVNKKGFCICSVSGMEITDNDFCSYGEKMDKE